MEKTKAGAIKTRKAHKRGRGRPKKSSSAGKQKRAGNGCNSIKSGAISSKSRRGYTKNKSLIKRHRPRSYPDFEFPRTVPNTMQSVKFNHYIKKVLKKVKPNMNLQRETMNYMDMILKDTLHAIAHAASSKMGKRKVLKPLIIRKALKKLMPKAMVERAHQHGQRALDRFTAEKIERIRR